MSYYDEQGKPMMIPRGIMIRGACTMVNIEPREGLPPLIRILVKDDGNYFLKMQLDQRWVRHLINQLEMVKDFGKKP